jgi:hypothetical protein
LEEKIHRLEQAVAHDLVTKDDHNLAMDKMASSEIVNNLRTEMHKLQTLSVTSTADMEKKVKTLNDEFEKHKEDYVKQIEELENLIADEGGDEDYDDEDDSNLDSEMLDEFDADGLNLKNSSSSGSSIKPKEEEQKESKEAPKAKGKTSQKNLKNIKI